MNEGRSEMNGHLILVIEVADGALERLRAAMVAVRLAAVVLVPGGGSDDQRQLAVMVREAQQGGLAALVEGSAKITDAVGADGVHLAAWNDGEAYGELRRLLAKGSSIGIDAGRSRHDAMSAGEAGADYVAFGLPPGIEDRDRAATLRREMVAWWAEIFEVPVVAFGVRSGEEARDLFAAGADFVAVPVMTGETAGDVAERVRAVAAAVHGGAQR